MKREIKFRGKRRNFDQWLYFDLFSEINSDKQPGEFLQYHLDENTIGQFTGMYDKKGVEIYEGDIVNDNETGKGIVVFQSGGCFMMVDSDADLDFLGFKIDRFGRLQEKRIVEIIGNIYENPYLLI
jgi:uncharacterized phage protein (TIGR01671 family)